MAKERGLEQISGHETGVDRHERLVFARRIEVNRLGDDFLARPAFALDEHRGAAGRNLRDQVENAQHRLAFTDDIVEAVALLEGAFELDILFFGTAAAHGFAHIRQELLVIPWLLDKVRSPGLHGVHGVLQRAVGSDHDDGERCVVIANGPQDLESILIRQSLIQQHQVEGLFAHARQALGGIGGRGNFVSFELEKSLERFADLGFVVDDEDSPSGGNGGRPRWMPREYTGVRHGVPSC